MGELRRDPVVGRWVIVDTEHPRKPADFEYEQYIPQGGLCPFCYGNEFMTPPEISCFRDPGTGKNTPGWQVRVVANKFPALQIEGDLDRRGNGIYDMSNGVGAHEVLIESPYHNKDIPELLPQEIEGYIKMCCLRSGDLKRDDRFKYIMIFRNYGSAAGASLEHPHTQLVALPMVPKNALEQIHGARDYYNYRERCIFCDMIRQEIQDKERIILENKYFLSFCPFVSRFPFEIRIMPKQHSGYFCHMSEAEIQALAQILKDTLTKLKKVFDNLSYNYIIHSAPVNGEADIEYYHWHIEIMP
ncbi:MAG: galactose-1-phosphate uridylyltransferase, partial [Candidatus Omnitrophica bacterium]|nr:galactose-1-phosphate uridylyltransferase [Candidatus Omnitrophota bacterium]